MHGHGRELCKVAWQGLLAGWLAGRSTGTPAAPLRLQPRSSPVAAFGSGLGVKLQAGGPSTIKCADGQAGTSEYGANKGSF